MSFLKHIIADVKPRRTSATAHLAQRVSGLPHQSLPQPSPHSTYRSLNSRAVNTNNTEQVGSVDNALAGISSSAPSNKASVINSVVATESTPITSTKQPLQTQTSFSEQATILSDQLSGSSSKSRTTDSSQALPVKTTSVHSSPLSTSAAETSNSVLNSGFEQNNNTSRHSNDTAPRHSDNMHSDNRYSDKRPDVEPSDVKPVTSGSLNSHVSVNKLHDAHHDTHHDAHADPHPIATTTSKNHYLNTTSQELSRDSIDEAADATRQRWYEQALEKRQQAGHEPQTVIPEKENAQYGDDANNVAPQYSTSNLDLAAHRSITHPVREPIARAKFEHDEQKTKRTGYSEHNAATLLTDTAAANSEDSLQPSAQTYSNIEQNLNAMHSQSESYGESKVDQTTVNQPASPSVHIGHIDIVVQSVAPVVATTVNSSSTADFLSRQYVKTW